MAIILVVDCGPVEPDPSTSTLSEPELPVLPSLSFQDIDLKIFRYEPWPSEFLKTINISIPPYGYQHELVQSAIKAKNTIICLPTGGGKTFVAGLYFHFCSFSFLFSTIKFSFINQVLFDYEEYICKSKEILRVFHRATSSDAQTTNRKIKTIRKSSCDCRRRFCQCHTISSQFGCHRLYTSTTSRVKLSILKIFPMTFSSDFLAV